MTKALALVRLLRYESTRMNTVALMAVLVRHMLNIPRRLSCDVPGHISA